MFKNLPVHADLHLHIKKLAVAKGLTIGEYLGELLTSQSHLSTLANDITHMRTNDIYRVYTEDKVIFLKCEKVEKIDKEETVN